MSKKRNKKPAIGLANEARRKAEANALAIVMRERAFGSAIGAHNDKRTKRIRTRENQMRFALQDWS
jgi:hypothetical protein